MKVYELSVNTDDGHNTFWMSFGLYGTEARAEIAINELIKKHGAAYSFYKIEERIVR